MAVPQCTAALAVSMLWSWFPFQDYKHSRAVLLAELVPMIRLKLFNLLMRDNDSFSVDINQLEKLQSLASKRPRPRYMPKTAVIYYLNMCQGHTCTPRLSEVTDGATHT